jgi:hypothetical protein
MGVAVWDRMATPAVVIASRVACGTHGQFRVVLECIYGKEVIGFTG